MERTRRRFARRRRSAAPLIGALGSMLTMLAVFVATIVLPVTAMAAETFVADLEQRVAAQGVDSVNAYLSSNGAVGMTTLNRSTASCELQAVSLSIQLARGNGSNAVDAHRESLRVAVGSCTRFVLALLSPQEVPKVCSSVASWTVSQMASELRRRIKSIEADKVLRSSLRGKACREAYLYELNNTRVGLRISSPSSAPKADKRKE